MMTHFACVVYYIRCKYTACAFSRAYTVDYRW